MEEYCRVLPEKLHGEEDWVVRRSVLSERNLVETFQGQEDAETVRTLYDVFERSVDLYKEKPYLGYRSILEDGSAAAYEWITYGHVAQIRNAIGSGMLELGVKGGSDTRVGLYSHNSVDWMLVDCAVHAYGMTAVPLYDTLGPDAVDSFIVHQCQAGCCVWDDASPEVAGEACWVWACQGDHIG
ncbi:hypothetical protein M9434_005718 [Picochlorum sp. BPE23]|nr:hypothetical protein M9434_005718 [Picochlorum sp. BPE23]